MSGISDSIVCWLILILVESRGACAFMFSFDELLSAVLVNGVVVVVNGVVSAPTKSTRFVITVVIVVVEVTGGSVCCWGLS